MAKNSKDIMHVIERRNKREELSFELYCSGKDPISRKNKVYVKTYKVPTELKGKKEIENFRLKVQMEFKEEVLKRSTGISIATTISEKKIIKFIDFATEWVEDILKYKKLSHNYYLSCKGRLMVMEQFFGKLYLHEISAQIVKNFCKWLSERTYKKEVVTVKESLKPIIKERRLSLVKVVQGTGLSDATLKETFNVGGNISSDSAIKLTKFLGLPLKQYFNIKSQDISYSQNSSNSIKNTLNNILKEAVRLELIERNYASKEYIDNIKGFKSKREIYNDDEVKQFIKNIEIEKDIRKQVAFSIYIYLGLRNAEVAGLEWQDINFVTSELTIQRNCLYVGSKFGIITKETKTKNSNRTIFMPTCLVDLLKQYKVYWDEQKNNHGDLWEHTDRLFCQYNGKDTSGMTLAAWLEDFQQRNGLRHVSPHGLRHTNITILIKNGIDVKTVSSRVGHANISTTLDIYSHFTKEADKLAANKIQEMLVANYSD